MSVNTMNDDHIAAMNSINAIIAILGLSDTLGISEQVAELKAQRDALAAENAGLKAGVGFFMYSEETGFEFHKTKDEAISSAEDMIGVCREEAASEGWPEDTDSICWGVIFQKAVEGQFEKPSEQNGWIGWSEYSLSPSVETPATGAFLAEVRAQIAEEALKIMGNFTSDECGDSVYIAVKEFAENLRKGVQS